MVPPIRTHPRGPVLTADRAALMKNRPHAAQHAGRVMIQKRTHSVSNGTSWRRVGS